MSDMIHLNLYDYTPVEEALRTQGTTRRKLMDIYGFHGFPEILPSDTLHQSRYKNQNSSQDDDPQTAKHLTDLRKMITAFCADIKALLNNASSTAIYQVNTEKHSPPPLFSKDGTVAGVAGVLAFTLTAENCQSGMMQSADPVTVQIQIHSRFDKHNSNGYFLMYMFEKGAVARGSVYPDMRLFGSRINSWDLMMTVTFIENLYKAMKKGLYRQYRDYERNDSRLRGRIDVARHLRENPIFNGRVAYISREYTTDNDMNVLILRTYRYLERRYPNLLHNLVTRNDIVRNGLMTLLSEVEGWQSGTDFEILQKTKKKVVHSVYREYEPLRETCHAVLTKMGVNLFDYTSGTDYVSGMMINLSHLWEEFLYYAVIRDFAGFTGPYKQYSYYLVNGLQTARPDYLIPTPPDSRFRSTYHNDIVLDAKYKASWGQTMYQKPPAQPPSLRNDIYQILAYQLAFDCKSSGVIFPISAAAASPDVPEDQRVDPQILKSDYEILPVPVQRGLCSDRFFARVPYIVPAVKDGEDYQKAFEKSDKQLARFLKQLRPASLSANKGKLLQRNNNADLFAFAEHQDAKDDD